MILFFTFTLFLLFGVLTLVVWPILAHPTLPTRRKLLFSLIGFIVIFPLGMALYWWLGVPQLAGIS